MALALPRAAALVLSGRADAFALRPAITLALFGLPAALDPRGAAHLTKETLRFN